MCTLSTKISAVKGVRGGLLMLEAGKCTMHVVFCGVLAFMDGSRWRGAYQRPWVRCGTSTLVNCDLSSDSCRIDVLYRREVAVSAH